MSTSDLPKLTEGDVLAGRYRVERVIARGGMGIVIAAKHIQLGHRVALKILHHEGGSPEQSVARFLTEAKASARLTSDHVVRVTDVGRLDSGEPFMVMEYLEGSDLSEVLELEGPLPVPVAVDYVLQAAEGIAEAHAALIVHRDLKPGNLFRVQKPDGSMVIKVLDFGVSKALSTDVRALGTVTTTDAVFGSPLYMAPEQMESATSADARSDVWSMGVVLFELLTRRTPFEADSMAGLAVTIATRQPFTLAAFMPSPPDGLGSVIAKCLQKKADQRYATVAELAADLEPFAPASRARVERIQRLIEGVAQPPRSVPSSISSRKLAFGVETLGPVDSGLPVQLSVTPRKSRAWMALPGLGFALAFGAAFFLLRGGERGTNAASPSPPPPPFLLNPAMTTAPLSSVAAPTSLSAPTQVTKPSSPARSLSPLRPSATPSARAVTPATPTVTVMATAATAPAPSSTVITGISRDRK